MYTTRRQQLENYLASQAKKIAMQDMNSNNVNTRVFDALSIIDTNYERS